MFEGKLPRPEAAAPTGLQHEGGALRPLAWQDLTARLAATRDLRAALSEGHGDASFDPTSARWIAAHREGEEPVNPVGLANRKPAWPTGDEALPVAAAAPRGIR